jgi:hypothetical protein
MHKVITASLAAAAFVSALSSVALANDPTTPSVAVGNEQVVKGTASDLNSIASTSSKNSTDQQKADRDFHPDYSRAITPAQMDAAWNAELERIFPPAHAGGG